MIDKLKSFIENFKLEEHKLKEHNTKKPHTPLHDKLSNALAIVTVVIYILVMFVSCPISASAEDGPIQTFAESPAEPSDNIVTAGLYYLNAEMAPAIVGESHDITIDFVMYSGFDATDSEIVEVVLCNSISTYYNDGFQVSITGISIFGDNCLCAMYNSTYGWNYLPTFIYTLVVNGTNIDNINIPLSTPPLLIVQTDQALSDIDYQWFTQYTTRLGSAGDTSECPTVEELLSNMSGNDALQAIYNSNQEATDLILEGIETAFEDGRAVGDAEGYERGLDESGKFSGSLFTDIIGNIMDAFDGFVIYTDEFTTITLLTIIRSLIAVFAIIWILKLIAGG